MVHCFSTLSPFLDNSTQVIDILIINYNCSAFLKDLLDKLVREESTVLSRRARFQVTVVDNASTDNSGALVEEYPTVQWIQRKENGGFSVAVNEGLLATSNREILLLNSDISITSAGVAALVRIWERMGCRGIVAPLHLEPDLFPQLTWGDYPSWSTERNRRTLEWGLAKREPWARQRVLAECCRTREVSWVSGSCLFFNRTLYEDVGLWDENFFLFFEDIDWCLRALEKGYPVYHTAEVTVIHAHGASVGQNRDASEIYYRQSQLYFVKKHLGAAAFWQWRLYLTAKVLGRWLIGSPSGFRRATSARILRNMWMQSSV